MESSESNNPIKLYPMPCYSDENIIVVVNQGTHSVLERSSRRSECYYRDFYVTNLSIFNIAAVIRFKGQTKWIALNPKETDSLFVDYSYMYDRIGFAEPYIEETDERFGIIDVYLGDKPTSDKPKLLDRLTSRKEEKTLTQEDINRIEQETPAHRSYHFEFDINVYSGRMKTSII